MAVAIGLHFFPCLAIQKIPVNAVAVFCAAEIKYYLSIVLSPKLVIMYGRMINLTKGNNEHSRYGTENITPA